MPSKGPIRTFGFSMSSFPPRRGAYGFDAPYAPLLMALGGACLLALSAWNWCSNEGNSNLRGISIFAPGAGALWKDVSQAMH